MASALAMFMNRWLGFAWNKWRELFLSGALGNTSKEEAMLLKALRMFLNSLLGRAWNTWRSLYIMGQLDGSGAGSLQV